ILENIDAHPMDISRVAVEHFDVSRATIASYLRQLIKENILEAEGNTKARLYHKKKMVDFITEVRLTKQTDEDILWRHHILPLMQDVPNNITDICQYCFT